MTARVVRWSVRQNVKISVNRSFQWVKHERGRPAIVAVSTVQEAKRRANVEVLIRASQDCPSVQ